MKIEIQSSAELAVLGKAIEHVPVAMLSHFDAEGVLVSRPLNPLQMDAAGALWFFTSLRSMRAEHLRVANLSFVDSAQSIYVSLAGRGELHADRDRIKRLWGTSALAWHTEVPASSPVALLKFVTDCAEYWDAPHGQMVRFFTTAARAGSPTLQRIQKISFRRSECAPRTTTA